MGNIYTLGQNGTNKTGQRPVFISGNGSDLSNDEVLRGRAKRKFITQNMMLNLMDVAKEKGDNEKQKAYWNTYYCQNRVTSVDGRLYGNYCKNRFCTLCCSIRKAEIINKYYPVIQTWEEPHFVTLTVKACKANQLKGYIKSMMTTFKQIADKYKKQHQRGTGIKLVGVKSLECNFNPIKKTYNPHFHIIVANKQMALTIIQEWLNRSKKGYTNRQAQDMRKVFNVETGLIEIIKYGSKIFTEPDIKKKGDSASYQIYVSALDNILTAMKGIRIFERFGFNAEKKEQIIVKEPQRVINSEQWEYNSQLFDWQNTATDEVLTGYKPKPQLTAILSNCIDITSQ